MIVLNSYKSHLSAQFEEFYKKKNIITFYLLIYSFHFIQPLNVNCFNVLKQSYNKELEDFIKAYINYIIKTEFFLAFKTAHFKTIIVTNIQANFRGVGLILYNP